MAGSTLTLTQAQIEALVQKNYPNLVIAGFQRTVNQSYGSTYFYFNARPKLDPTNPVWTSSDGRQTPVGTMAITHVQNALAKVIQNDYGFETEERTFWINAFVKRLASEDKVMTTRKVFTL